MAAHLVRCTNLELVMESPAWPDTLKNRYLGCLVPMGLWALLVLGLLGTVCYFTFFVKWDFLGLLVFLSFYFGAPLVLMEGKLRPTRQRLTLTAQSLRWEELRWPFGRRIIEIPWGQLEEIFVQHSSLYARSDRAQIVFSGSFNPDELVWLHARILGFIGTISHTSLGQ